MKKAIVSVASVAVLGAVGGALLSVSMPACSCVSPAIQFAMALQMPNATDLGAQPVAAAANRLYAGQALAGVEAPKAARMGDCMRSPAAMECTYLIASGKVREERLVLRFVADGSGKVERVEAQEVRLWRWS